MFNVKGWFKNLFTNSQFLSLALYQRDRKIRDLSWCFLVKCIQDWRAPWSKMTVKDGIDKEQSLDLINTLLKFWTTKEWDFIFYGHQCWIKFLSWTFHRVIDISSVWVLEEDDKADMCLYISHNMAIMFSRAIFMISMYLDMCMVVWNNLLSDSILVEQLYL